MKSAIFFLTLVVTVSSLSAYGQANSEVLATANGFTFTGNDLSREGQDLLSRRKQMVDSNRRAIFDNWISEQLFAAEATKRNSSIDAIKAEATAKVAPPTEVQIKAVYDANKNSLGDRTIEQIRPQILQYLRRDAESKQLSLLRMELRGSHKYAPGKDVNAADLKDADVVATIGTRNITAGEFKNVNRVKLSHFEWHVYEDLIGDLESAIFGKLIGAEAKKRNTDGSGVIAAEVTDKLKVYSDYERMSLEDALRSRLFSQYDVKYTIGAPEPFAQNVSVDDDPFIGTANAKATVVVFVDFQCSACAAFSPLLKQVVAEFGNSARLVVRDFPLDMHENAMQAALAGYAARQQGKFFEMGDLMYRNQSALDVASLKSYAKQLGMDVARFDADMKSPAAEAEVKNDMADGNAYGVSGTPTIFVNGKQVHRMSTSRVREAIQEALK